MFADVLLTLLSRVSLVQTVNSDMGDALLLMVMVVRVVAIMVVAVAMVPDTIDEILPHAVEMNRCGLRRTHTFQYRLIMFLLMAIVWVSSLS